MNTLGFARNGCRTCGSRFFTSGGLHEHLLGCKPPVVVPAPAPIVPAVASPRFSPEGLAAQQARGRDISSRNNARRVRCDDCGHVSTPAGAANHQRHSGHVGRTELALEKAA